MSVQALVVGGELDVRTQYALLPLVQHLRAAHRRRASLTTAGCRLNPVGTEPALAPTLYTLPLASVSVLLTGALVSGYSMERLLSLFFLLLDVQSINVHVCAVNSQ